MSAAMRIWLAWVGVSIVVDVVLAILTALAWPHLEAAILTFGLGMGWASLTPLVIRRLGRWLRE